MEWDKFVAVLGWVLTGIAVIGTPIGIISLVMVFRDRAKKRLHALIQTSVLINKELTSREFFNVKVGEARVSSVRQHKLWLWSSGASAIRKDDIPPTKKVHLKLSSKPFLHIEMVDQVGQSFEVVPSIEDNLCYIEFDHLNSGDGIALQVIEATEADGAIDKPLILGHIIDGSSVKTNFTPFILGKRGLKTMITIIGLLFIGYAPAYLFDAFLYSEDKLNMSRTELFFGGLTLFSMFLLLCIYFRKSFDVYWYRVPEFDKIPIYEYP